METCRETVEVVIYRTGSRLSRAHCISCRWSHDLAVPVDTSAERVHYTSESGRPSSGLPQPIRTRPLTVEELQAIHDGEQRPRRRPPHTPPASVLPPHLRGTD
jgi:hypothetical protein